MGWQAAGLLRQGQARHLVRCVSSAVRVIAKVFVLEAVGVHDVVEGDEWQVEVSLANCGTEMG